MTFKNDEILTQTIYVLRILDYNDISFVLPDNQCQQAQIINESCQHFYKYFG